MWRKAKPSAEAEETPDELRARLLQLAADYLSAFWREPNEESLEMWQLLLAMSSLPDRRRKLAQYQRQLASKAARTDPKHPDKFWRKDDSFTAELTKCRSQGPWNPLLAARAVLRGCGISKDDAKSLLRNSRWEEWVRTFLKAEHHAT